MLIYRFMNLPPKVKKALEDTLIVPTTLNDLRDLEGFLYELCYDSMDLNYST